MFGVKIPFPVRDKPEEYFGMFRFSRDLYLHSFIEAASTGKGVVTQGMLTLLLDAFARFRGPFQGWKASK